MSRITPFLLTLVSLLAPAARVCGQVPDAPYNTAILGIERSMTPGGMYSASEAANTALREAVTIRDGRIRVDAAKARPSYCSEATYLVFLKLLEAMPEADKAPLDERLAKALRPGNQPDGVGIWGRWNANGPGTAVLFHEQKLGTNFTDPRMARPGDFLKIFWNENIGASEHGHSVIYLGRTNTAGVDSISFWSSNQPNGYGERTVPVSRIKRFLFSRLLHPERLHLPDPWKNDYLSSLVSRSSTPGEMNREAGISTTPRP